MSAKVKEREDGVWCVICWGPIEKLSNGHFVRTYGLVERISKYLKKKIIIVEYTEDALKEMYYKVITVDNRIVKLIVPGNESRLPPGVKYALFILYQFINTIKARSILSRCQAIVLTGELFLPTLFALKLISRSRHRPVIITDLQMLLSERELRRGNRFMALMLRMLEKVLLKLSSFVVAISAEMKVWFTRIFGIATPRIIVLKHTLPLEVRRDIVCNAVFSAGRRTIGIIFVGAMDILHNLEAALYLIGMAKLIKQKYNNVHFYLVGKVDEKTRRKLLNVISRIGVDDVIEIVGFVKDLDDFICIYGDILVAPMFTMSGVSTKMLYYLRFREKVIVASREALEGIALSRDRRYKLFVGYSVGDFLRKLMEAVEYVATKKSS